MDQIDLPSVIEIPKAIAYIRSLEKQTGGFGATRRLPATIEDTYHSVAVFKLLGCWASLKNELIACRGDRKLSGFLARLWMNPQLDVKSIYQLYATAMALDAGFDPAPLRTLASAKLQQKNTLRTCYYTAMILGLDIAPLLEQQLGPEWQRGLFPFRRTCEEMLMALEIVLAAGGEITEALQAELVDWFQRCQTPDGGFGFLPGTTSFIENGHFCLKALARLHAKPAEPKKAVAFIAGCQTCNGGFGRRGKAAPFLDSTFHAIACLILLRNNGRTNIELNSFGRDDCGSR
jgi:hypothetical protein